MVCETVKGCKLILENRSEVGVTYRLRLAVLGKWIISTASQIKHSEPSGGDNTALQTLRRTHHRENHPQYTVTVRQRSIKLPRTFQRIGKMNVPLEVVQDDQGRLRDVNDQPMIMIFNSKPRRPRTSRGSHSVKRKPRTAEPQSFAFINVTRPDKKDEDARKLIRTHVMQDLHRRESQKPSSGSSKKRQTSSGNSPPPQNILTLAIPPQPPADGPAVIRFPIQMQPYMHRLIHQCA